MRGAPVDGISNLPSDILDNILKYLPVRDAVRTSILSRKWRYQWVTMPHLIFYESFKTSLIYHILSLHNGAITKFLVKDRYRWIYQPPPCDRWLFFLSDRYLEDLTLASFNSKMPLRLFDFKQLKHLYMDGFEISELPPTFEGFTRLVKLELLNFHNKDGRLGNFLSKCPMLEYLNLTINGMCGEMEELPKHLYCLTVLKLGVCFREDGHASCVLSLIKSSPTLRCLDISVEYYRICPSDEDESNPDEKDLAFEYLKAQHKDHVPFSCLEDVKIYRMSGYCVEMEFLKILLSRAVALRTLKIESDFGKGFTPAVKMLRKLEKFPRASKFARITFVSHL